MSEATPPVPPKKRGLSRVIAAAGYSIAGLRSAFGSEEAFRLEVVGLVVLTPLALWLGESSLERVLMIGSVLLLLIVELLNTAVESVVNRVGLEFHELSRQAKDIGSAAVFLAMAMVALVWIGLLI